MSVAKKKGRIEKKLGKECQIAHGSPRRDEDTKAYTKNLQILTLWWV